MHTRALLAAAAAGAVLMTAVPAPGEAVPRTTAAVTTAAAPAPVDIAWTACGSYRCATVQVPLDYDNPNGPTTPLRLLKAKATRPEAKLGTIFVNPGGPGGPSTMFAEFFGDLMRPAIRQRYDVIGIDPRGVGRPTTQCRTDVAQPAYPQWYFPMTDKQIYRTIAYDKWARNACRTGGNPITSHLTTADVARDMDLIRASIGAQKVNYYGVSYGSYLGATYAAMFPDRVGRFVIDGVLDPVAWATGRAGSGSSVPFSTRLRSGAGAAEALTSAFKACDKVGRTRCAISGDSLGKWQDLVRRLKRGPFTFDEGGRITYSELVGGTLGYLYSPDAYPGLMSEIGRLHRTIFSGRPVAERSGPMAPAPRSSRGLPGPYSPFAAAPYGVVEDSFAAIACADTTNPTDPYAWKRAANNYEASQPWYGRQWTWASSRCANWPTFTKEDRFTGPFTAETAGTMLIIGNRHDPATPYHGAVAARKLFPNSSLLTFEQWGHGAIGGSTCILDATRDYFLTGTVPADGAVCRPDSPLFPR